MNWICHLGGFPKKAIFMAPCTSWASQFDGKFLLSCIGLPNKTDTGDWSVALVEISEEVIGIVTMLAEAVVTVAVVAATVVVVAVAVVATMRGATCSGGVNCGDGLMVASGSSHGQGHFDISCITECCTRGVYWCKHHVVCLLSVIIEIAIVGAIISMHRKMDGIVLWLTFLSVMAWLHIPCPGLGDTPLIYHLLTRSLQSPAIIIL